MSLKAMLPLLRSGKINTLACPATGPAIFLAAAIVESRAASTYNSPSISIGNAAVSALARASSVARRIFMMAGCCELLFDE